MINNLLAVASDIAEQGYPKKIGIGEATIDAVLGFLIVFIGIAILVGIVWLVGFVLNKVTAAQKAKDTKKTEEKSAALQKGESDMADASDAPEIGTDVVDEETVAVITAAIMAYYAKEKPKCEFTVKRIKRI